MMQRDERKRIVVEFLNLGSQGRKFKEGLRFFSSNCKTHNPYIAGTIETLVNGMDQANQQGTSQYPEAQFSIKEVLVDGDFVAVHTELLSNKNKPGEGGLRQMHLFRFDGEKIVEYWDITQQVLPNMPNAAGAY
jgi:predicted SnoaL-like aldol condensation-catalyzing enzyme